MRTKQKDSIIAAARRYVLAALALDEYESPDPSPEEYRKLWNERAAAFIDLAKSFEGESYDHAD